MMEIKYITDQIYGEPGPSIYFEGETIDFWLLSNELHKLGTTDDLEIILNGLDFISTELDITFTSSKGGDILCKADGKKVSISLDKKYWPTIIEQFMSVSYYDSHNYVELSNLSFTEDANLILSSKIKNAKLQATNEPSSKSSNKNTS